MRNKTKISAVYHCDGLGLENMEPLGEAARIESWWRFRSIWVLFLFKDLLIHFESQLQRKSDGGELGT